MKLFIVGSASPIGIELIALLEQRGIKYSSPAEADYEPLNAVNIAKLITDYSPDQIINLATYNSASQTALFTAEKNPQACISANKLLPAALAEISDHLNIPLLHLSNCYVFNGEKKLGYNEQDETQPIGVYGSSALDGEQEVAKALRHIILRPGWLFGPGQHELIDEWLQLAKQSQGRFQVAARRFSPTPVAGVARVIFAICQQVDCDANVWGCYHYGGLETKKESEFVEQTIKYAAQHDEHIYQLIENMKITESSLQAPEIPNSTLSSKKLLDTFGIKQKSWHGSLQETVKAIYQEQSRSSGENGDKSGDRSGDKNGAKNASTDTSIDGKTAVGNTIETPPDKGSQDNSTESKLA